MALIKHPNGGLCSTFGMNPECKDAKCVYYDYGYHSKCKSKHDELNIKQK